MVKILIAVNVTTSGLVAGTDSGSFIDAEFNETLRLSEPDTGNHTISVNCLNVVSSQKLTMDVNVI